MMKQLLIKENISHSLLNIWSDQELKMEGIKIIDIYNLNPIEYKPFILKHF